MRIAIGALLLAAAAPGQIVVSPTSIPNSIRGSRFPAFLDPGSCIIFPDPTVLSASGGAAPYSFRVSAGSLPTGVQLNQNGTFSGEAVAEGSFSFTVEAQDSAGQTGQRSYSVSIGPPPDCFLRPQTVGRTFLLPFGCGPGFTHSSPHGTLPPGVVVDPASGVIVGVPTQTGDYSFGWRCESGGAISTLTLHMTILPVPRTVYSAAVGASFDQTFDLGPGASPFTYAVTQGSAPPGLQVSGTQPRIFGTPTALGASTFRVVRTASSQAIVTADFTINVLQTAPSPPTVRPGSIRFNSSPQAAAVQTSPLTITASADTTFQANATTESGGLWLTVSPSSGLLAGGQAATLQVQADDSALPPGSYVGSIVIRPAGEAQIAIPVTLAKARLPKQLKLSQSGVAIQVEEGSAPLARAFFDVVNLGTGSINWTASASTLSGGDWLRPIRTSGDSAVPADTLGEGVVVEPGNLAPGAYYGQIEVSAPDAAGSPQQATVVLEVLPAGAPVTPLVQPTGFIAVAEEGVASVILRPVRVTNTSAAALSFTTASQTEDGGPWLPSGAGTVFPPGGPPVDVAAGQSVDLPPGGTIEFAPRIETAGLARGVYRGTVEIAFSNGSRETLRAALVTTPTAAPLSQEGAMQSGPCTPSQTVPVLTQVGGGGPPAGGWAQPITVQAVDDCGNPITAGSASTTLSGVGTTQTVLTPASGGFSGTLTPPAGSPDSTADVTATVTAPDGAAGSTVATVTIRANPEPPPAVAESGIVHAASFAAAPSAPGTIVSIFGENLSPESSDSAGARAESLPLSDELGSTRVTLAGEPLPLLFVRADQINAILPFELGDRAADDLDLVVERTDNQTLGTAQPILLSAARPGIFTQSGTGEGPGSILDAQFRLVDSSNPAGAGDAILIFAAGLGATDPAVPTGQAAPSAEPLARATQEIAATIGGVEAPVLFAGLTPGFAGLFQVNVLVPEGLSAGEAEVMLFAAGQPSRPAVVALR